MKTKNIWSIFITLTMAVSTIVSFSSCNDDDDEELVQITASLFENTLWHADLTMADPMISKDFVDVEVLDTRYFFAENGEAIVSTKYKEVSSITGYETGEIVNYARYEVVDNQLKVTLYKTNGSVDGSYTFQMKGKNLVNEYETVKKVRSFNTDDKEYVEGKLLYYAKDEVRLDFEISGGMQKRGEWRYESKGYYLYVDAGFSVGKDQKLAKRGFTEVVAEYSYYNTVSKIRESYKISLPVNEDEDIAGYKELLLEKKYSNDKALVYVSYKVWDHRDNVYKSLHASNTYEF